MSTDYGSARTDVTLSLLEKRIEKLYREASDELKEKIDAYFEAFKKRDEHQKALLADGKITEEQYKQWRLNQIGRGKRFERLRDEIAERYTKANEIAVAYVNDETPGLYSLNRNYSAYTIEKASGDVGFTLWDEQTVKRLIKDSPELMPYYPEKKAINRGIDLAWGKKVISRQVTGGILQGESIGKIANRLQTNIPEMNMASAIRTARTAVTGAQNAGRMDSYLAAEKMGIKIEEEWVATLDGRTRHSHAAIDGEIKKPGELFSNRCRFPGDPQGPPHEVYNCRCTTIAHVVDAGRSEAKRRSRDPDTGRNVVISDMTFSEWERWKGGR